MVLLYTHPVHWKFTVQHNAYRLIVFWQTEGGGGASLPPTLHRLYVPEKSAYVKQISIILKMKKQYDIIFLYRL